MSVLLFKLRGVADDEADEVRSLLAEHDIAFYETNNGRWGIGYAAIWLHDDTCFEQGKALIKDYQIKRYAQAREQYETLVAEGTEPTVWKTIKARPLQVLLAFVAMVIVAMFALVPFVWL